MLFSTPILDMAIVSNNHERGQDPGGGGGTLLYQPYTYLVRIFGGLDRVWFSRNLRERTCTDVFIVSSSE